MFAARGCVMIYCPRQFVLNFCGLTLLMLIAAAVARTLLGVGAIGWPFVLSAPVIAASLEGAKYVRVQLTVPHPKEMWRAAYGMASIYVQIVLVLIIALVLIGTGQSMPNIMNVRGVLGSVIFVGSFLGMMTICLRFGFWCGVQNALNQLRA